MAEIDFADGFDVPEPLAWGLTPAQLGVAVTGAVLAYLDLRSPLPRVAAVLLAVAAVTAGLAAALARYEGRTLISWAAEAARFWTRPRSGLLTIVDGSGGPGRGGAWTGSPAATGARARGGRLALVLLPEPVLGAREGCEPSK